jgi:hypothetical protein
MAVSITGSVGSYESGARNLPADIRTVQDLLTQAAKTLKVPAYDPNGVDGQIARPGSRSNTVKAITSFQRNYVGMSNPDQRIDVNGTTWKRLVAVGGNGKPKTPTPPAGLITLTAAHGGKIPTNTKFKKTTPPTAGGAYESTFTLSGGLSGSFRGSIYPDDMTIKGRVVDGTWPLHIGFHKGGTAAKQTAADLVVKFTGIRAGLLVNARSPVPILTDHPNNPTSEGINVHNGYSASSRGSEGCLTLHPDDWSRFIQTFLDAFPDIDDWHTIGANTGKKIGSLVIKAS